MEAPRFRILVISILVISSRFYVLHRNLLTYFGKFLAESKVL